ncbi:MAG TPA: hypothetical protein VGJ84_17475, partial [Polyangiaceae bacterium]
AGGDQLRQPIQTTSKGRVLLGMGDLLSHRCRASTYQLIDALVPARQFGSSGPPGNVIAYAIAVDFATAR